MKSLIKICTFFMIFTTLQIFSTIAVNDLLEQNLTTQIALLNKEQYPENVSLSTKNVNFIAPNYTEDMYLYCYYPFKAANGQEYNESQRLNISKNNHFTIKLIKPRLSNTGEFYPIILYLVPRKNIEEYINVLTSVTPLTDGLADPDSIKYGYSAEKYQKINDARKILKNDLKFVARIDFTKIQDGDTIHLPEYKADVSTPKTLPSHPATQEPATTSSKMIARDNEKILTLRIPEQEIKIGINFSN